MMTNNTNTEYHPTPEEIDQATKEWLAQMLKLGRIICVEGTAGELDAKYEKVGLKS